MPSQKVKITCKSLALDYIRKEQLYLDDRLIRKLKRPDKLRRQLMNDANEASKKLIKFLKQK